MLPISVYIRQWPVEIFLSLCAKKLSLTTLVWTAGLIRTTCGVFATKADKGRSTAWTDHRSAMDFLRLSVRCTHAPLSLGFLHGCFFESKLHTDCVLVRLT